MLDITTAGQVAITPPAQTAAVDRGTAEIEQLQVRAGQLELRMNDLGVRETQLADARDRAGAADRPTLEKQWAAAQHDGAAAGIQLSALKSKIARLEESRHITMASGTLQAPPAPDVFPNGEQVMQISAGGMLLVFPLVLALARRLWVRGGRGAPPIDIDSSPRLQRMELAIEAIAVEVERIGESQRFTMKVLAERPTAVPIPSPKREIGSITPH